MKAVSCYQPWATLLALGTKRYETRSWRTDYQGEVAIHAALAVPDAAHVLVSDLTSAHKVPRSTIVNLPRGAVVAVARLVGCWETEVLRSEVSELELRVGDWSDGRWAWKFSDVRRLVRPIPAPGFQRLWEWTPPDRLDFAGEKVEATRAPW